MELALDLRHEAANQAYEIVAADVEKYLSDQRARGAAAIVSELREYFDEIVESELAKRESELADLPEGQREKRFARSCDQLLRRLRTGRPLR